MPAPIEYGVQIADPTQAFLGAFQAGASIQDARLKQEQQTQQQANQALILKGFEKLRGPDATATDYANLAMMLPETQAKAVRESFSMLSGERQQTALQQAGEVFSAFKAGKPAIAISRLEQQIEGKRNSGDEAGAKFLETWRDIAKEDPKATEDYFGFTISQMPGGKDVISSAISLSAEGRAAGKGPSELAKAVADADKAVADAIAAQATATNAPAMAKADADLKAAQAAKEAVAAEFARAKAVLDVQQQAATLRKTDADILIAQETNRIAALNAAQAKETNVLRRQELQQKIDDATKTRDAADRDQKATVANQSADIDNFLNTAQRVLNTPQNVIKSATGPVASRLPTLSADVADFEALVEALGSQAFIAQIPKIKGTGSLSEKEGDKLQASLQTLSLKQSPERLKENVTEAVRLLEKVRGNIALKYGVQAPPSDVPARELNVTVGGTTYNFPTKAAADAFRNSDAYRRAAGNR
jgi:hypothetical protein